MGIELQQTPPITNVIDLVTPRKCLPCVVDLYVFQKDSQDMGYLAEQSEQTEV